MNNHVFLSTLSLRRATPGKISSVLPGLAFLSTLSLRRATPRRNASCNYQSISIHALLAESDAIKFKLNLINQNFYPRSPCGERPHPIGVLVRVVKFLSTLSLRRATLPGYKSFRNCIFLSTLSLRRATYVSYNMYNATKHFYPRSPCGERRSAWVQEFPELYISIHALLAESDRDIAHRKRQKDISIHALLAESDNGKACAVCRKLNFYPRSPCGERQATVSTWQKVNLFLSTLSLRRATVMYDIVFMPGQFLSTLSLRRATE